MDGRFDVGGFVLLVLLVVLLLVVVVAFLFLLGVAARTQVGVVGPLAVRDDAAAVGARRAAVRAALDAGDPVALQARAAAGLVAHLARAAAPVADPAPAGPARVQVVRPARAAAVGAALAGPVVERHVRRGGVVGLKYRADQHERVAHPALPQGLADRPRGLAGAQGLVADVGVCDLFVRAGRVRLGRDDVEAAGVGVGAQTADVQLDRERAELHALQGDRVGRDDDPNVAVLGELRSTASSPNSSASWRSSSTTVRRSAGPGGVARPSISRAWRTATWPASDAVRRVTSSRRTRAAPSHARRRAVSRRRQAVASAAWVVVSSSKAATKLRSASWSAARSRRWISPAIRRTGTLAFGIGRLLC